MKSTIQLYRVGRCKNCGLLQIIVGIILLSSIMFSSCENFLNGGEFKTKFDNAVEYANAPFAKVEITVVGAETAFIIPAAGTYFDKYKSGDVFEIKFESQTGYGFSQWQAVPEGSVTFEDENSATTTVKINSSDAPITIKPYSLPRPKVVSATPTYDSNGVYRDRTIVVMFNKEMDEKSIYWTKDELEDLGVSVENAIKIDDSDFYYAYRDSENLSSYVYKNIEITKYNDSSVNLLQYYGVPRFDRANKKILRIPANNDSMPPSATDILVTLKKDFFYKTDDSDPISLSDDYDWPYYTNGSFDDESPVFVEDENNGFTVTIADNPAEGEDNQKFYKRTNAAARQNKNDFDGNDFALYKSLNSKNKKLWVRGSFTDVGSGPGSLKWEVYKVGNNFYPCTSDEEQKPIQAGQIKNLNISGFNASINSVYDQGSSFDKGGELVEITELKDEGLYRIDFIASDKNERSARKSYYFVHDAESKSLFTENLITNSRPDFANETVSWNNPSNPDFDHAIVECWLDGNKIGETFEDSAKSKSAKFTGLENQKKYEYRFYSVDIYGNKSNDYVVWKDNNAAPVTDLYSDAGKSKVTLHFTTPSTEDFDHIEVYKNSSTTKETLYADKACKTSVNPTAKSTKYMVRPNTNAGYSDTWKVYAFDFAGNKSEVCQIKEGYAKPGMIVYQTTEKGEPIVSSNWYGNFKCVGVLYTVDDYINVARTGSRKGNYVWDITEYPDAFIWGKNDYPAYWDTEQHDDGKQDYNKIVSGYREQCVDYRDSRWPEYETVWHYLEQTRNKNNQLLWWLPAIDDYKTVIKYIDNINAGVNFINSNGGSAVAYTDRWYASSSVSNEDNHKSKIYELNKTSFPDRSHRYSSDTWKDKPGYGVWHFMTEVPLD